MVMAVSVRSGNWCRLIKKYGIYQFTDRPQHKLHGSSLPSERPGDLTSPLTSHSRINAFPDNKRNMIIHLALPPPPLPTSAPQLSVVIPLVYSVQLGFAFLHWEICLIFFFNQRIVTILQLLHPVALLFLLISSSLVGSCRCCSCCSC